MAERNERGKEGEAIATGYLKSKGYTILHTNWHFHHYELDIIASDGEWLVIVEVKTRSENYLEAPEGAVDRKKIRRIVTAADAYIRFFSVQVPVRFDIVTVILHKNGAEVEHIDDAFYAPCR